jgi:hypothetical protein
VNAWPWPGIFPRNNVNKHARRSELEVNTHAARSDKLNEVDKPAEPLGPTDRGTDTAGNTPAPDIVAVVVGMWPPFGESNPKPGVGLGLGLGLRLVAGAVDDAKVANGTSEGNAMRGKVGEGTRRTMPATPRMLLLLLLDDTVPRAAVSTTGVFGITTDRFGCGGGLDAELEMEFAPAGRSG